MKLFQTCRNSSRLFNILLAITISLSCQSEQNTESNELSQARTPATGTLAELIYQNTPASRFNIADQISTYLKEFPDSESSKALKLLLQTTRSALINGPHSLCSPDERLTFYRGVATVFKTAEGKPFAASSGTYVNQSVSALFKTYALETTKVKQPIAAISPYIYAQVGDRHTLEINPSKSAFLSISAVPMVASSFGTSILKLSMCPTRALSTPTQAYPESEFLPALIIFPEEIVGVMTSQQAFSTAMPLLGQCYGPESGGGDVSHSKKISYENLSIYNELVLKNSEPLLTSTWKVDFAKFLKEQCDCPKMVARKNILYKKMHPTAESPYSTETECE